MLPERFRRSFAMFVPIFTALLLVGFFDSIFEINLNTNIANTGITVGMVFLVLNGILAWMVYKHKVP